MLSVNYLKSVSLTIVLCIVVSSAFAEKKLTLRKAADQTFLQEKSNSKTPWEKHPLETYFSPASFNSSRNVSGNPDSLLVLLIDFQEDNSSQTTGNGKFDLSSTDTYPLILGAPPHNQRYFTAQVEAVRYYWKAASFENFDLKYDVFPETNSGLPAYTLPNEMSYYNPPGASSDLMVSRFEEYFRDAFTAADQTTPEINFARYKHFMLIHAGSDWQHDINADSPGDIPSFFIKIGTGKEVYVDNGSVMINYACNVPETISQDFFQYSNGVWSGYGAVNAVFAHEFGHSLGMVDLYNTRNFSPSVGYFDIYDSGGSTSLVHQEADSTMYYVEGVLPALPGAWSRINGWEEEFRQNGILKDISDFTMGETIEISAAEVRREVSQNLPHFIKVPITDKEYYLIENKNLDPDEDGGVAFKGTSDFRVILYPTYTDDSGDAPTYEYDWLLPGWTDISGNSYGGGLLIWHIDDEVIYDMGVTYSDGFVSNFDNNSVNTNYYRKGVKIVEADTLHDIGSNNSYAYYLGTAYEYFFRNKPRFTEEGYIDHTDPWMIMPETVEYVVENDTFSTVVSPIWNNEISSTTNPALEDNFGNLSLLRIYNISRANATMTFAYGMNIFAGNQSYEFENSAVSLGEPGNETNFLNITNIPVYKNDTLGFLSHNYSEQEDNWFDYGINSLNIDLSEFPITNIDMDHDNNEEFMVVCQNKVIICKNSFDYPYYQEYTFTRNISSLPLFISEWSTLVVPLTDSLCFIDEDQEKTFLPGSYSSLTFNGTTLFATDLSSELPVKINQDKTITSPDIPSYSIGLLPVHWINAASNESTTFLFDKAFNIYKINDHSTEKIFSLKRFTEAAPTQMGIATLEETMAPYLVFGAGDLIFALDVYGNLKEGFPAYQEARDFSESSFPRVVNMKNTADRLLSKEPLIIIEDVDNGYHAFDKNGHYLAEYSLFWNKSDSNDYFFYEQNSGRLYFTYLLNNKLILAYEDGYETNPVVWSGYRNGNYSLFSSSYTQQNNTSEHFHAYVFPNPVSDTQFTVRVCNAKENISLDFYDIAGNHIYSSLVAVDPVQQQDININNKFSSGVYFAVIKSGNDLKKFKFAIEK